MIRQIEKTKAFRKDWKRVTSGIGAKAIEKLTGLMIPLTDRLAADEILEPKWRDHALSGDWAGHRDLHVRPDLVLIYTKSETPDGTRLLSLVRLGSHSELGIG